MQNIHAMGLTTVLLDQLDLVELLRKHLGATVKIELIDDLDHRFGVDSKEFCWVFGTGSENAFDQWIDQMKKDGYVFDGAHLLIDNGGRVAGIWPGKEIPPQPVPEVEKKMEEAETKIEAISATEISASVSLKGTDDEGKIVHFKVRGKYKKRQQKNFFSVVDLVDIDIDNDLNKEDIKKVLDWINECESNLLDYTIEGPGYKATQFHVHNFSVGRICLDNLHAAVLDNMIKTLQDSRNAIKPPQSATRMQITEK